MEALASIYLLVFAAFAGVYVVFYLVPLLTMRATLATRGLQQVSNLLARDLAEVRDERLHATDEADAPRAYTDEDGDGNVDPVETRQQWAAERLGRLEAFQHQYRGIVQEAVDQIRAQYPNGAYQRFEIERLPAVAAFSERVSAARTMAGLFVLLGLLFTMIRLNGVVRDIAAAAGGETMDPATFLTRMGELMGGIGGAFDSSIWGLGLLVLALVVVGGVDWSAQRRVHALEAEVTHRVIPALTELQNRLMPNLTLADLLAETGEHLMRLSTTVNSLNGELDRSLSSLGDRIGAMMTDFRSFQDQYERLDGLLGAIRQASTGIVNAAAKLDTAAKRNADPLTTFNRTLLQHVEQVADWVEVSRDGFDRVQREIASVREHTDRVVDGLAHAAETGFGEGLTAHRRTLAALDQQIVDMRAHLAQVASEFERATQHAGNGLPA